MAVAKNTNSTANLYLYNKYIIIHAIMYTGQNCYSAVPIHHEAKFGAGSAVVLYTSGLQYTKENEHTIINQIWET